MTPKRVLLIDDDPVVLNANGERLHQAGYAVQLLLYPTLAVTTAKTFEPDVVICDMQMPVLSGREVLLSLKSFPETKDVPVVLFTSTWTPSEMMRTFVCGAVDLWTKPLTSDLISRLGGLLGGLDDLTATRRVDGRPRLRHLFLAWHAKEKSTGTLLLNQSTPFEGRAIFADGQLTYAKLGPLYGEPALDEMLSLDAGTWRWEAGLTLPPQSEAEASAGSYVPKVLVVDDDESLRLLTKKQLERQGFKVELATDGLDGHSKACLLQLDAIVADLNMPVLDGWGMLRALKGETRLRETPVLVLSAHDDYRETLEAARAGAHDYLGKTGHSDELVKRLKGLTSARVRAHELLSKARPIKRLDLSLVGSQWLLRQLSELDCTVRLDADDDWGHYTLRIDRGHLMEASAQAGTKKLTGSHALTALLVSRGAVAQITPETPPSAEIEASWLPELLEESLRHLSQLEGRVLSDRLGRTETFTVDVDLAALFVNVGADAEVRILRAISDEKVKAAALAAHLKIEPERVREALGELLRRGVLRLP